MFLKLKLKFKRVKFQVKIFWKEVIETLLLQAVFFVFFFLFEKVLRVAPFNFPPNFPKNTHLIVAYFLFFLFFVVIFLSLKELSPSDVAKEKFKQKGIYNFLRHPFYGAIVFLLNPAISILLRSFGLLIASFISFFFWRELAKDEERRLIEKFSKEYQNYKLKVSRMFFPKVFETAYSRKKALFYILIAVSSFFIVLVGFNLYVEISSRNVGFEEKVIPEESPISKIEERGGVNFTPTPEKEKKTTKNYKKKIDKYAYKNGTISIPEANVKVAPIVFVKKIKYVNFYHKFGVVHYPGTSNPGEKGTILLSGHSSGPPGMVSRYNYVFSKLNNLNSGDKVIINYEGEKYIYRIFRKKVVWPNQVKLREYKGKQVVTLLSCWPVGTNSRRIIVEAERIN